jgi:hypothetical protein
MRSWLCLIVVAACGGKHDDPTPGAASGSASAPPPVAGVQVFIDDKPVATVTPDQVAAWPRLVTLLPTPARRLGQWVSVSLKGAKDPATDVSKPSMTYPDTVPVLYPDGGGTSFGMFDGVDLAKHGAPKMHVDQLKEVRITLAKDSARGQNETGDGTGTDPADIKLSVKTAKGEQVIAGKTLLAMTLQPMPGNPDSHGWTLTTILDTAGVKGYSRLLLTDATGTNLTIDKADFDDKTTIPFIKLNRQGSLRFTILKKQGEGWEKGGDLRGLASIEVVK